ncbi:hypothetical protein niasHS_014923 [Heterodera schachtii]|uniref:ShKT domain-containing protein n=1 Tax=Heterodera schachtii TaxID=97005 RepID=A0ABD2IMW6_HETSC
MLFRRPFPSSFLPPLFLLLVLPPFSSPFSNSNASVSSMEGNFDNAFSENGQNQQKNGDVFRVFRIFTENWSDVKAVRKLSEIAKENAEVDFWLESAHPGQFADVMVSPEGKETFQRFLAEYPHLHVEMTVDDVQKLIMRDEFQTETKRTVQKGEPKGVDAEEAFLRSRRRDPSPAVDNGHKQSYAFDQIGQLRGVDYAWGEYTGYSEMVRYMRTLEFYYPNLVQLVQLGSTHEGRSIEGVKIGYNGQIFPQPSNSEHKPKNSRKMRKKRVFWIDGNMHAREWASGHTALFIINQLVWAYEKDPFLTNALNHIDFVIVPCTNPDGFEYSRSSVKPQIRLWRKNRSPEQCSRTIWGGIHCCRGVDLNRNFDFHWAETGSSLNACSNLFAGKKAFSEPEAKAIADFLQDEEIKGRVDAFITLHTYAQLWIHPFSHEYQSFPNDVAKVKSLALSATARLREVYGTNYKVGTGADLLSPASGGSDDWAKQTLGVKFVYLVELRPQLRVSNGFILRQEELVPTAIETFEAIKVVIQGVLVENVLPSVPLPSFGISMKNATNSQPKSFLSTVTAKTTIGTTEQMKKGTTEGGGTAEEEGGKEEEKKEGKAMEEKGREGKAMEEKGREGKAMEEKEKEEKTMEEKGKEKGKEGKAMEEKVKEEKGREGKAREEKGREGKALEEKGREGKGREGKGKEENGREGKAMEEKGREGKAMEEKGREGKGREGKGKEENGREGEEKGKEENGREGKESESTTTTKPTQATTKTKEEAAEASLIMPDKVTTRIVPNGGTKERAKEEKMGTERGENTSSERVSALISGGDEEALAEVDRSEWGQSGEQQMPTNVTKTIKVVPVENDTTKVVPMAKMNETTRVATAIIDEANANNRTNTNANKATKIIMPTENEKTKGRDRTEVRTETMEDETTRKASATNENERTKESPEKLTKMKNENSTENGAESSREENIVPKKADNVSLSKKLAMDIESTISIHSFASLAVSTEKPSATPSPPSQIHSTQFRFTLPSFSTRRLTTTQKSLAVHRQQKQLNLENIRQNDANYTSKNEERTTTEAPYAFSTTVLDTGNEHEQRNEQIDEIDASPLAAATAFPLIKIITAFKLNSDNFTEFDVHQRGDDGTVRRVLVGNRRGKQTGGSLGDYWRALLAERKAEGQGEEEAKLTTMAAATAPPEQQKCRDERSSCAFWIRAHPLVCIEQMRYMRRNCAFSCNFCPERMKH